MSERKKPNRGEDAPRRGILAELSSLLERCSGAQMKSEEHRQQWAVFYELQRKRLAKIGAGMQLAPGRIDDLIQETWLATVTRWDTFRVPGGARRLLAWTRKVMHDKAVDLIRAQDRHRAASLDGLASEPMARDPKGCAAREEELAWLSAALDGFCEKKPEDCRLLWEHHAEGRKLEDLAAETGLTVHTIRNRINKLRRQLRRHARRLGLGGGSSR